MAHLGMCQIHSTSLCHIGEGVSTDEVSFTSYSNIAH